MGTTMVIYQVRCTMLILYVLGKCLNMFEIDQSISVQKYFFLLYKNDLAFSSRLRSKMSLKSYRFKNDILPFT